MSALPPFVQWWWGDRAERLLEEALAEVREHDVIPTVGAALVCLRIEAGEVSPDEMEDYPFPGEEERYDAALCVCPPDLVERGGFKGGCPIHAHA